MYAAKVTHFLLNKDRLGEMKHKDVERAQEWLKKWTDDCGKALSENNLPIIVFDEDNDVPIKLAKLISKNIFSPAMWAHDLGAENFSFQYACQDIDDGELYVHGFMTNGTIYNICDVLDEGAAK